MTDRFRETPSSDQNTTPAVSALASRFETSTNTKSTKPITTSVSSLASKFINQSNSSSNTNTSQPSVGDISKRFISNQTNTSQNSSGFASAADTFKKREEQKQSTNQFGSVAAAKTKLDDDARETTGDLVAGVARAFESKHTTRIGIEPNRIKIPNSTLTEEKKTVFKEGNNESQKQDDQVDLDRFKNAAKLFEMGKAGEKKEKEVEKGKDIESAKSRFQDASKMFGG